MNPCEACTPLVKLVTAYHREMTPLAKLEAVKKEFVLLKGDEPCFKNLSCLPFIRLNAGIEAAKGVLNE